MSSASSALSRCSAKANSDVNPTAAMALASVSASTLGKPALIRRFSKADAFETRRGGEVACLGRARLASLAGELRVLLLLGGDRGGGGGVLASSLRRTPRTSASKESTSTLVSSLASTCWRRLKSRGNPICCGCNKRFRSSALPSPY
eukprot:scaffold743_cov267-Pinguiococcus_pyrenoidosus.AAC.29